MFHMMRNLGVATIRNAVKLLSTQGGHSDTFSWWDWSRPSCQAVACPLNGIERAAATIAARFYWGLEASLTTTFSRVTSLTLNP